MPPQTLIGRRSQRDKLTDWLRSAANRQPATVLVSGDAGVGKTSLIEWFAKEAAESSLVLKGACIELGSGAAIPYGALTEAMRLFVRQLGPERAQHLAGRSWPTLGGIFADSVRVAVPNAAPGSQMRVFGAVLKLSDYIGKRAPLVLIFEDIHWADTSTLDLIRYVTKAKTDQQMMLVCSFRRMPARHQLHDLLGDEDFQVRVESITLAPFDLSELTDYVTTTAGREVSAERVKRYLELSEGNAYFAQQLVMADDPKSPDVVVPLSLRELMMARLARLSDEATEVVRIAAVAGRQLSDDLLASVSELDERALEQAVLECMRHRILIQDGTDDAYTFQHALLRETAYRDFLVPRSRKRIHARMAEALSAQPGDKTQLLPVIAYHWFESGRLPDALAASVRAAGQAVRVHAFPEAQAQYDRALRLWPDVADAESLAGGSRERILGLAADAARWAGKVPQALDRVRHAISEVDAASDPDRAGELQERLGSYLWEAGQHSESAAAYAEADRLLSGLPPSAVASRVQSALATVAVRAGEFTVGLQRASRAVELADAVGAAAEKGRALNSLGLALAFAGKIDEGEQALRTALAIAADGDHLEDLFRAYGNLGVCLEHGGRLSDAVDAMTEGLARAEDHGLLQTRQSSVLANNAAAALWLLGRYDEAASLLDSVLLDRPIAESMYARLTRAEIHVAKGNFADADRLLNEIRTLPNLDPRFVGPLYGCLAEAAVWQNQLTDARDLVAKGVEQIAGAEVARVVVQLCAVGLRIAADMLDTSWADELMAAVGRVAAQTSGMNETGLLTRLCHAERARVSNDDTAHMWAEIADGWARLDQPFRKAYAQSRLADAAARSGDRQRAAAMAREAYATGEALGAQPLRKHIEMLASKRNLRLGKPRPYDLTDRELDILRHVCDGISNPDIGKLLTISPATVGVHVGSILKKMGVAKRGEAAAKARREGIIVD